VTEPVLHLSIPVGDLAQARTFYEEVLGCRVGRVRETWLDVWFFGMQVTLQERPDEVRPAAEQGVRHFGVTLADEAAYHDVVGRLRGHGVTWLSGPTVADAPDLSGKASVKVADPSGNVIELKCYPEPSALGADR
jgi:hypothetical protein